MVKGLDHLEDGIRLVTLAHEEEAEADANEPGSELVRRELAPSHHEHLEKGLNRLVVRGSRVNQSQGEPSRAHNVGGLGVVSDDGHEQIRDSGPWVAGVRQAQAHNCRDSCGQGARGGLSILNHQIVRQESESWVAIGLGSGAGHPNSKESARENVLVFTVQVLVHHGKAAIDIPEGDQADTGGGADLPVVLVLEDQVALAHVGAGIFLGIAHELVLAEPGVDKAVDKGVGQVLPGGIDGSGTARLHQVLLEDVLGSLGLHNVQVSGHVDEVLAQF